MINETHIYAGLAGIAIPVVGWIFSRVFKKSDRNDEQTTKNYIETELIKKDIKDIIAKQNLINGIHDDVIVIKRDMGSMWKKYDAISGSTARNYDLLTGLKISFNELNVKLQTLLEGG